MISILGTFFVIFLAFSQTSSVSFYPLATESFYPKALTVKEYSAFMTDYLVR